MGLDPPVRRQQWLLGMRVGLEQPGRAACYNVVRLRDGKSVGPRPPAWVLTFPGFISLYFCEFPMSQNQNPANGQSKSHRLADRDMMSWYDLLGKCPGTVTQLLWAAAPLSPTCG